MQLTSDGHIYYPNSDGQWVSQTQRRVAEILRDYNPYLELQWIPTGERSPEDYAFRVVHRPPNASPYAVCFGHEADERLLAKVIHADQTKTNALSYLDSHNAAIELLQSKEAKEKNEEATRIAYAILRSNKIHYKHNGIDFGKWGGGRFK